MKHTWHEAEIEELLEACLLDCDVWGFCTECGGEICPVEPDAGRAWCDACGRVVKIDGLLSLGLV